MPLLTKKFIVSGVPTTWPRGNMPRVFPRLSRKYQVDLSEVLLLIGRITLPVMSGGASLSEFWAHLRYMFAWSDDEWMTINSDFYELDAHQKTILSDDIGMGLSLHWLSKRLQLIGICDGRYFIERHLTTYGGTYTGRAAKRGPGKAPDFICLGRGGKFHVVECKGTQTSPSYRDSQLGLPMRGGVGAGRAQKRTVTFPPYYAGHRLACGTYIATDDLERTHLKIVDPEEPPILEVREDNAHSAVDPIARSQFAQMLRAAGFPNSARVTAFPEGRPMGIQNERFVFASLEERASRLEAAHTELRDTPRSEDLTSDRGALIGRRIELELPAPLIINERPVRSIELRQGINPVFIKEAAPLLLEERIIERGDDPGVLDSTEFYSSDDEVVMSIGSAYRSELHLIR